MVIEWDPPTIPNGILQKYLIQRRVLGSSNPSNVAEVNASLSRRYVDNTARPITTYQYRIIAYNSGPGEPSPYSNVTTGEGGKSDGSVRHRGGLCWNAQQGNETNRKTHPPTPV